MELWSVDVFYPDGTTRHVEFATQREALRAVAMHFDEGAYEVVVRVRRTSLLAQPLDDQNTAR